MNTKLKHNSIKFWHEADRPREKLLNKGCFVLSDAELIAILVVNKTVNLELVGVNGNAFMIMAVFQRQARKEGWTQEDWGCLGYW